MKWLFIILMLLDAHAKTPTYTSEGQKFTFEVVLQREEVIWGLDFMPDNQLIFTERSGKMFLYNPTLKKLTEVLGVPKVAGRGQGGLLDVKLHPDYSKNKEVYFTYAEPLGELASTTLARAVFKGNQLTDIKKLFTAHKPNGNDIHFGSRIVFDKKGAVFITVGDRHEKTQAQDLSFHMGKVIRINTDGSIPKDNPFVDKKGALPEIYSYGHRNPQGLALHPETGELWEAEMGPKGGDEVNLIRPGKNYGWPIITHGREYTGSKIGEGTHKKGMEGPIRYWVPSISPSGMTFYNGPAFPQWKGNLFLACLSSQQIRRVDLKKDKQEELLKDLGLRFRQVVEGPEGYLYITTDEGIIGRIRPVILSP